MPINSTKYISKCKCEAGIEFVKSIENKSRWDGCKGSLQRLVAKAGCKRIACKGKLAKVRYGIA